MTDVIWKSSPWWRIVSIIIAKGYAAALCIIAAGRVEARRAENWGHRPRSKLQAKLRPKGPKMGATSRYYGKDQADGVQPPVCLCYLRNCNHWACPSTADGGGWGFGTTWWAPSRNNFCAFLTLTMTFVCQRSVISGHHFATLTRCSHWHTALH